MTKKRDVSRWLLAGTLLAASLWLQSGCGQSGTGATGAQSTSAGGSTASSHPIPAGTRIDVTLGKTMSSETAQLGDEWHGTVARDVVISSGGRIAAGSRVSGEVVQVTPARRGSRASLELGMTTVSIDGADRKVTASSEAVTAGSTRKRNLGAIAGGVVAGALIGKSVGDGRNATAGALVGGAAATGVVAESKGFQVVLTDGTMMRFTVSEAVAMR